MQNEKSQLILAGVVGVACGIFAVYAVRRWLAQSRALDGDRDMVDVAVEDSFPASDPPSWTAGGRS